MKINMEPGRTFTDNRILRIRNSMPYSFNHFGPHFINTGANGRPHSNQDIGRFSSMLRTHLFQHIPNNETSSPSPSGMCSSNDLIYRIVKKYWNTVGRLNAQTDPLPAGYQRIG